jgi:hypothetical protein
MLYDIEKSWEIAGVLFEPSDGGRNPLIYPVSSTESIQILEKRRPK